MRRGFLLLGVVVAAAFAAPARADTVDVNLDQAKVMRLPERVATIIIGNPLIADASLQSGGIIVITGKGYGSTNLLALDRQGRVVMDKTIQVSGPSRQDVVVVYKGIDRETYSCAPECAPRITLGDTPAYFGAVLGQTGTRNGSAGTAPAAK
ncbi:MAG: pilus assembly protein N-terminal domain-containing protein [Pseudolabrys sp.]|nr:pilus assembly protein N-terminal domain-containing protein [Pseudolabrys sp.]